MVETKSSGVSEPSAGHGGPMPPLPADALIIVPVRSTVLFPGIMLPITIGRQRSIAAAQQAVRDIVHAVQKSASRCSGTPRWRIRPRSTCIGWARSRMWRATSPPPTAGITRSAPGRAALPDRRVSQRLAVPGRARAADSGAADAVVRDRGADAAPARAGRRGGTAVAAGAGRTVWRRYKAPLRRSARSPI